MSVIEGIARSGRNREKDAGMEPDAGALWGQPRRTRVILCPCSSSPTVSPSPRSFLAWRGARDWVPLTPGCAPAVALRAMAGGSLARGYYLSSLPGLWIGSLPPSRFALWRGESLEGSHGMKGPIVVWNKHGGGVEIHPVGKGVRFRHCNRGWIWHHLMYYA
jgi:hypothetical protein